MKGYLLSLAIFGLSAQPAYSENVFPLPSEIQKQQPGAYEKHSIEDLLEKPHDEELVKLSGQIIKKLKCSTYLFRDETGEIRIEIKNEDIPEKGLLFKSPVIIKGEVSLDKSKPVRVEAEKIRYVF